MPARSSCGVVRITALAAALAACTAGNNRVDPGDLELRDILGISPDVAVSWNDSQRAAARRVLAAGLRDDDAPWQHASTADPIALDQRIARLLAIDDTERAGDGLAALGVVRIALEPRPLAENATSAAATTTSPRAVLDVPDATAMVVVTPRLAPLAVRVLAAPPSAGAAVLAAPPNTAADLLGAPHTVAGVLTAPPPSAEPATRIDAELWLAESWDAAPRWSDLPGRGTGLLVALAADAGHPGGPVIIVPVQRLAVIAAYVRRDADRAPPRLLVNPVVLAALEPIAGEADEAGALDRGALDPTTASPRGGAPPPLAGGAMVASSGGNPYSFYGSVAECASAQRERCNACLPSSTCRPITNIADGNAECTMLDANSGRGYFLLCINLALAITSIDRCTGDAAPTCVRDPHAADTLATLENNASFLADPGCGDALDGCLAQIFGPPGTQFPGLDAGTTSSEPPRSTSVSCGNSCNNNNQNTSCNASPTCDCSGPSCNNSLSCDSACSSSNDQSGCGGNCNACTSSGGSGGGGGGGCGGGSSSSSGGSCSGGSSGSGGNSGCGNSCSSGSSGSSNNSGCSSGCSGGSSSSGCSGGGCSSSSSSSGSSCGGGGGGGGGKCNIAAVDPAPGIGLVMSAMWGCLPITAAALARRRARRRRDRSTCDTRDAVDPDRAVTACDPASTETEGEP